MKILNLKYKTSEFIKYFPVDVGDGMGKEEHLFKASRSEINTAIVDIS